MQRLSSRILPNLPSAVRRPQYDRAALRIGMAHIGVGAFHRCHQAEYTDDMLEARFGPWGLLGINLFPPRLADLLVPQDCLYSRTLREGDHAETRVIGSIKYVIDVLNAVSAETAFAALAALEEVATAILGIAAIFGTDLVRPDVTTAVARDLSGLLGGDARGYLTARLQGL